jgi:hypothetical protein
VPTDSKAFNQESTIWKPALPGSSAATRHRDRSPVSPHRFGDEPCSGARQPITNRSQPKCGSPPSSQAPPGGSAAFDADAADSENHDASVMVLWANAGTGPRWQREFGHPLDRRRADSGPVSSDSANSPSEGLSEDHPGNSGTHSGGWRARRISGAGGFRPWRFQGGARAVTGRGLWRAVWRRWRVRRSRRWGRRRLRRTRWVWAVWRKPDSRQLLRQLPQLGV